MPGRILVVDDVATNRLVLQARLASHYFDVLTACDGLSALEVLRKESVDVVLLDVKMPGMTGFDVCRAIKADPATAHIPVVMITASNNNAEKIAGLDAGAEDFLAKHVDKRLLVARIQNLLRLKFMMDELRLRDTVVARMVSAPTPCCDRLLAGADSRVVFSPGCRQVLPKTGDLAKGLPARLHFTRTMDEFHRMLRSEPPDAIVISDRPEDANDPLRLLSQLRSQPSTRGAALLMLLGKGSEEKGITALEIGANDCLIAPFHMPELLARLRIQIKRKKYSDLLRTATEGQLQMALRDALTGVYNRCYAEPYLARTLAQAASSGRGFTVMMLDLDRFKAINDTYGHPAGDAVLRECATRLTANLRGIDMVARVGGEEFLIVLPDMKPADADIAAERLRTTIAERPVHLPDGRDIAVTVSIGALHCAAGVQLAGEVLEQADRALYRAKNGGRDRVCAGMLAA